LSVRLGPGDGGRILVHSFAGDDWQQCRDHVREKLDLASRRTSVTSGAELAALAGVHADTTAFVKRLWHGSERAAGTLVETYLRGRGMTCQIPPTIRFLPRCFHRESGTRPPAMAAAVQGPSRQIVALVRTWLKADGGGKAAVTPVRKTLGSCRGGAVRLGLAANHMAVAEGIETALSVMQASGVTCWAALGSNGLCALILPPLPLASVVTIAADNDHTRTGIAAAHDAAARWTAEGRTVRIALPPPGMDFNDLLCEGHQ